MKKIFTIILSVVIGLNLSVKVWGQVNISEGSTVTENFKELDLNKAVKSPPKSNCLTEDFHKCTDGTHASPSGTNISNNLNQYTNTPGWTGDYIFQAGGEIKLSSGSGAGYIITPSINLSNGAATLYFDAATYSSDATVIQVYHASNGTSFSLVSSDIYLEQDFNTYSVTISGGSINSKIKIQNKNSTKNRYFLDNIIIDCADPSVPTVTVNPSNLSNLDYYLGFGPSEEQSFTVSGTNLTNNISLTAPTNYEISTSPGTGFLGTINLTPNGSGTVATQTIYVRLKAGLTEGTYNETINISSSGATAKTVTCTGSVIVPSSYCFEENFDGFPLDINNDVASDLDTYTSTDGWTGDKIFPADKQIKLGSSGNKGFIITPTRNLSDGDATIHFDAASWSGDNAIIKVFHASNGTSFTQVGSEINLTNNYSFHSVVISGGTINSKIKIEATKVSNCRFYLDNFKIECADPNPTINVSPNSLTNFEYYLGYGPSETQSFTVSGTSLSDPITLTAPTNYEISLNSESGFSNSLSIGLTGGIVPETLIYVRLKAGLNLGSYNSEIITITSTGASSKTVSCSGTVSLAPVTDLSLICSTNSTAEISWTSPASNYDGVVIAFRNSTTLVPHTLSGDPSTINASSVFGSGHEFGNTTPYSYVVYQGTGNSVVVSGLTTGQTYKVKAYVYKGTTWLPDTQCPTMTISNLGTPNVNLAQNTDGDTESELSWVLPSAECFDQILIVAKHNSSVNYIPSGDASTLTANSIFGSGDDVGSNQYVVYKGTGTGLTITGLTNGQTYYAKIFVRKDTDWSSGVELVLNPKTSTVLKHGDLAILAINTKTDFGSGDEISIVSFKPIAINTSIDFTDNGYERVSAGKWGDTEGTIRLTRKNTELAAGKVITFEIKTSTSNIILGDNFNIYVDGAIDNLNWTVVSLNGNKIFDLNVEDQIWIMQNGNWINPPGTHDATYTGNVLYGWTATGWKTAPGYASTSGSTIYPGCECATTNVTGLTYKTKVKYTGSLDPANKYEWIARINNPENWTGYYGGPDDTDNSGFNSGLPNYKGGVNFTITAGEAIEAKWMGYKNSAWCNCANWYNLRVPNENTDVEITPHNSLRFDLKLSAHPDSLAVCKDLIVKGDVYNAANASLKVKGNFTLDGGSMNFNTNAINFEIGGDMSIDNVNSFKTSQANTKLNGTSIQNINGNSEVVFGTLTIDKPSAHVVLAKNIKVSNINFIKGKINTGTNRVFIDNTATNAIGSISPLSYINGNLRRAVASTGSYTLPVGNDSNFELATVELNSSSGLTHLDARFDSHVTSTDISSLNLFVDGTILQSLLDAGYWTIAPNSGLSSINYDISLDMRGATNAGAQAGQHTVIKRDNSSSNWYLQGNHTNATQSISGGSVHAVRTGLTSFSEFSIAKHNLFILPVELISFEANCNTDFVELNWITVSETNNDYFIVQRSQDATNWKNLSKIQGAGFSSSEKEYEYIDNTQVSGNMYYRLVQVDFDGTKTISNIVNVNCINKFEIPNISIYPNPANDILNFSQAQTYEILDIQGRVLMQSKTKQNSVNISELKEGMYFIKFENELLKFIKY